MATRMGVPAAKLLVPARGSSTASRRHAPVQCSARASSEAPASALHACRLHLASLAVAASVAVGAVSPGLAAAPAPAAPVPVLCDAACVSGLDRLELVTLPNGLKYRDIEVGKGPTPESGFQVVVDYVAMTEEGRIFDNSLEKGKPYDIRLVFGGDETPEVVAGLNEGVKTMRPGGLRRLYIPGELSFPKGLPSGPGRPRVPPAAPLIFDVKLLLIPGLDE